MMQYIHAILGNILLYLIIKLLKQELYKYWDSLFICFAVKLSEYNGNCQSIPA